jgi:hypothetical protein
MTLDEDPAAVPKGSRSSKHAPGAVWDMWFHRATGDLSGKEELSWSP